MSGLDTMNRVYQAEERVTAVHLDVTYRCNFSCIHCVHGSSPERVPDDGPELDGPRMLRLLAELQEAGVFHLTLSGGEPGVRADMDALVAEARRRYFDVHLKTNGTLFQDPERAKRYADWGVRTVDVTVLSLDPTVNDRITLRPGSLDVALRGMENARAAGMRVRASLPVMRPNLETALATYEGLVARGYGVQVGAHIHGEHQGRALGEGEGAGLSSVAEGFACHVGDLGGKWALNVDADDYEPILAVVVRDTPSKRVVPQPQGPDTRPCKAGDTALYVSPSGQVRPCAVMQHSFGSLRERSFVDILHSPGRLAFARKRRRDLARCQGCLLLPYCGYCMAEAERLTGDPFLRHPFQCATTARVLRARGGRRRGSRYVFEPDS